MKQNASKNVILSLNLTNCFTLREIYAKFCVKSFYPEATKIRNNLYALTNKLNVNKAQKGKT